MTGPRRSHRKSRNGCAQCKRRRVKCDEREPRCNNCTKHGIECDFSRPPTTPGHVPVVTPHGHGSISSSEPSPGSLVTQPTPAPPAPAPPANERSMIGDPMTDLLGLPGAGLRDLELMHHWSVETSLTMTNRQDLKRLWQVEIPREALSHEFLMRGILAITSLHLSHLRPQHRESYTFTALSYQNVALKFVQSAMREITRDNCNAVFAFASLVLVSAFATPHFEESLILVEQSEDATAEWVNLIRGVHSILTPSWEWIRTGTLGSLVLDGFESQPSRASAESITRLSEIQRLCEETADGLEAKATYTEAMMQLKHCFFEVNLAVEREEQLAIAFVWPAIVPEGYMAMLRRKRPEALVILAHYCISLYLIDDYWWMKGRAYCLVKNINRMLDERWRRWIQWPAAVVGFDGIARDVARSI